MKPKILIMLVVGVLVAFVLGFGGIWLVMGGNSHETKAEKETQLDKHEKAAEASKDAKEAALTSTMDLFQLTLPCKRNAQGDTPVVHADFQLVVPVKHRLKVEENTSRIRDIIATILRNTDIETINSDNLVTFKKDIIKQAHDVLGVDIEEVLVIRFDYDIMRQKQH
jgi:flagellar basal body-associated protein FliL